MILANPDSDTSDMLLSLEAPALVRQTSSPYDRVMMNEYELSIMPFDEYKNPGIVLVFLHGFPDTKDVWSQQIKELKNDFHIMNFNLPLSDDRRYMKPVFIIETLRTRLLSVAHENPDKKFILIGHDLGSVIMEELSRELPYLVQGQILISGMGLSQFVSRARSLKQIIKSWYMLFFKIPGAPEFIRKVFRGPRAAPIYLYQEISTLLSQRRTSKSGVRTLFISGKDDPFLLPVTHDEAVKFHEDFNIIVLEGKHWIQKERAREVTDAIREFAFVINEELRHVE
jgi:pimeloyl-ACP methyl ester carboxylesterase